MQEGKSVPCFFAKKKRIPFEKIRLKSVLFT